MTFTATVPQGNQQIRNTQSPIQTNFGLIDTAFNDATNGNFTKYIMTNVGTVSLPVDPAATWHMLNGLNFFSGHPIPYFSNSQGDFPLMPDLKTVVNDNGFKIGNIIVNYGFGSVSGSPSTATITFAVAFTSSSSFAMVAMPKTAVSLNDGQWSVNPTSGSAAVVTRGSVVGNLGFLYIAVGT